ncbi:MAG: glucuronate isomerase [Balneolaceae bacterium]|nr:MAG: glucuronate isomerase [Balneolaceae bacterium]
MTTKSARPFIHDDFLLQTPQAVRLYHEFAAGLPIVDYHNHLLPNQIAEDITFRNFTHIWLDGDHYKWRAMRTMGIGEHLITGDAADRDKFMAWAITVPHTLKNPLYHWTHLELKRYFGIDELLNRETAPGIWDRVNEMLQSPEFSTRGLLRMMNVCVVCTTDDAIDSLEHHTALAGENRDERDQNDFVMFPTFRPDNAMKADEPGAFRNYVKRLAEVTGTDIRSYAGFLSALQKRHDFFGELGCRASDHGIEEPYAEDYTGADLDETFQTAMRGNSPGPAAVKRFKSALMHEFALMDAEKGWAFQMHMGAIRNNNKRALNQIGPDSGFDSIGDFEIARPLSKFLSRLDLERKLPKTILYNLNSADNEVLATMTGNFQGEGISGKMQHGPGWWFHDQKEGMEAQLQTLSNMGLMSQFVGMVTDSRSFLSFPRHEYYRRILCNMLGTDMQKGIVPEDYDLLGDLIVKVCYTNALQYFSYSRLPNAAREYQAGK